MTINDVFEILEEMVEAGLDVEVVSLNTIVVDVDTEDQNSPNQTLGNQ